MSENFDLILTAGMADRAIEKLEKEFREGRYDRYGEVMKHGVLDALKSFCRQDAEFAEAVVQGGDFSACMKAVAKGCGGGISDLDAYSRAVQFYFPTAAVRFHMTVDLAPHAAEDVPEAAEHKAVVLNLEDFW